MINQRGERGNAERGKGDMEAERRFRGISIVDTNKQKLNPKISKLKKIPKSFPVLRINE